MKIDRAIEILEIDEIIDENDEALKMGVNALRVMKDILDGIAYVRTITVKINIRDMKEAAKQGSLGEKARLLWEIMKGELEDEN